MKPKPDPDPPDDLSGYEVVVGVCGGIAAYKVGQVVSTLIQRGASVTVAMTESATRFVGPTTFAALTGRPVITSLWTGPAAYDPQHVRLTEALDLLLLAPATYNMIGKLAGGIADDAVSTLAAAANSPVLLAPAMNTRMWENPVCRANVQKLTDLGYRLIDPGEGWLACRTIGPGRMAEAEEIVDVVTRQLRSGPAKAVAK
ncbi:MAG: hypothetical protein GY778_20520 [bacterium]|nr:hypothetical protein [bacterium]